jgi:hypothetical protein
MSALGHKRTFCFVRVMSAFTPESGHSAMQTNVCLGPKADMTACLRVVRFTSNYRHYISTMSHSRSRTSAAIGLQDRPCVEYGRTTKIPTSSCKLQS